MKLKLTLAILTLAASPVLAMAECMPETRTQSTSQCLQGQTWDATTQTCVPVTSS
jgi:hypothetical protein